MSAAMVTYAQAQVAWLGAFRTALASVPTRQGRSMGLIPNFAVHGCGLVWDDPIMQQIRDNTDGILDEAGFTGWGQAREVDPLWSNITMYALDLQQHGRGYYSINECGPVGAPEDAGLRLWIVASYLMAKAQAAAVFLSGVQQYGRLMPAWPEFAAPIGAPLAMPVVEQTSGLWRREYSNGTVAVNAGRLTAATLQLSPQRCYRNVSGGPVVGHSVLLQPLTATVVTFAPCL